MNAQEVITLIASVVIGTNLGWLLLYGVHKLRIKKANKPKDPPKTEEKQ